MTRRDVRESAVLEEAVCETLGQLVRLPTAEPLGASTVLLDGGLGLDSIAVLELLLALEKRFSCRITTSEITPENLETVGSLVALIERKVAGRDA